MKTPDQFLIIDDDPSNNLLCKASIKKTFNHADFVAFTTSAEGVNYIATEYTKHPVPTILFLDLNMPPLAGWDVLSTFHDMFAKLNKSLKIYILSSSIDPADKLRAAANDLVEGYIEKPLSREKLQTLFA